MRLIDADGLPVTTLTDGGYWTKDVIYKADLDAAPTVDAIIPVRCAECKFRTYDNYHDIYYCANTGGLRAPLSMDNFCPYGKRKSGTQPQREGEA